MVTQYLTDSIAVKKDSGEILFLKHDTRVEVVYGTEILDE